MRDVCAKHRLEVREGSHGVKHHQGIHLRILMAFLRRLYPRNLPRHSGGASDSRALRY